MRGVYKTGPIKFFFGGGDLWDLPRLQVAITLQKGKLPVNLVAYNANQVYGAEGNI